MKKSLKVIMLVFIIGIVGGSSYLIGHYFWENPIFREKRTVLKWFWVYPTDLSYAKSLVINSSDKINALSPTLYGLNEMGYLESSWLANQSHQEEFHDYITFFHSKNISIHPMIGTGSNQNARILLNNNSVISHFIDTLNLAFEIYGFNGINIDFEHLDDDMRNPFLHFFQRLRDELPSNITLSIDAPAFSKLPKSGWGSWFDFENIGKIADYVMIMTYDAHGGWSDPGEVAPISWVQDVLARMVRTIPVEKIFVGIPMYGYDWSSDPTWQNWGFGYSFFENKLTQYNGTQSRTSDGKELFLQYTDNNGYNHVAYYCDVETTWAKEHFLTKYPVAGYCYWHIGCGDPRYFE